MNANELYVALDIGTSTVKVIVGEMIHESLNIIGAESVKSEGLRRGSIVDIDETVQSIRRVIEQAERMVGINIRDVIVGITGNHIGLRECRGIVAVSSENREVTQDDVTRVLDAAKVMNIPPEQEIIDIIPKEFIVDGLREISDPRGMIGVRLEVEGLLITASKTILHNLLRCVERAGLTVVDICLQPMAAGTIALSRDEKEIGVALVDIGGGSTTVSFFEQGFLQDTFHLPVGGEHITKDVSIGLKTSTEEAEKIKLKYGQAFYDLASTDEVFSVPVIGTDQYQQRNQLELANIIEARLEEVFQMVQQELKKFGVRELPGGYVLTGGVASMQGVIELARDIWQSSVRIAIPDYIGVREPKYTTGVGMISFSHRNAKFQDGQTSHTEVEAYERRSKVQTQPKVKKAKTEENVGNKMKKIFGYFFE